MSSMASILVYIALTVCALELLLILCQSTMEDTLVNMLLMLQLRCTKFSYDSATWHDMELTRQNNTYPICEMLAYYKPITRDSSLFEDVQLYNSWLRYGSLVCGKYKPHTLSSLLGWKTKKRNVAYWNDGCARRISAAKRKLHTFLTSLCSNQATANNAYQQALTQNSAYNSGYSTTEQDNQRTQQGATDHKNSKDNTDSRGIVYTGEPRHFKNIYLSLTSLVLTNTSLPAEVWVNHYAFATCRSVFRSFNFVQCRCFGDTAIVAESDNADSNSSGTSNGKCTSKAVVTGFESKFHALLSTQFQHVLYLDADNIVTRNPVEVFQSVGYRNTGAVLWPDLWGAACRDTSRILAGHTASPQYVLWKAQFPGLDRSTHYVPAYYYEQARCVRDPQCKVNCQNSNNNVHKTCYVDAGADTGNNTTLYDNLHTSTHNTGKGNFSSSPYLHNKHDNSWRGHLREHAQEAESGQIVLNLRRHKPLLHLGLRIIQDRAFFRRVFYGDKDIFRYIFLITGVPFHYMGMPAISVDATGRQDSLLHFHSTGDNYNNDGGSASHAVSVVDASVVVDAGSSSAGDNSPQSSDNGANTQSTPAEPTAAEMPLFVHQLRLRDPDALLRYIRVPADHRHNASYCLVPPKRSYISTGDNSVNASSGRGEACSTGSGVLVHPPEFVFLQDFARVLFSQVDAEWEATVAAVGTNL